MPFTPIPLQQAAQDIETAAMLLRKHCLLLANSCSGIAQHRIDTEARFFKICQVQFAPADRRCQCYPFLTVLLIRLLRLFFNEYRARFQWKPRSRRVQG